jgi:hypothetical protein
VKSADSEPTVTTTEKRASERYQGPETLRYGTTFVPSRTYTFILCSGYILMSHFCCFPWILVIFLNLF